MTFIRNIVKAIFVVFYFLTVAGLARGQVTATSAAAGPASNLNFSSVISPQPEFIGNGSHIWFAVVHQGAVYFLRENAGFTHYSGGSAPAFRAISSSTETIELNNWDTSSNAGDDVFIGLGSSFQDMVDNLRFVHVHTFPPHPPTSISLTPTSLVFGQQGTSITSEPKQLTLRNSGRSPLQLRSISTTGGFAAVNNCGSLIQPNGCRRQFKIDHLCQLNFDQGSKAGCLAPGCG